MSPLVALSSHANGAEQCLLSGQKRTWPKDGVMSALLKADFGVTDFRAKWLEKLREMAPQARLRSYYVVSPPTSGI
jgi:hypothetical protein